MTTCICNNIRNIFPLPCKTISNIRVSDPTVVDRLEIRIDNKVQTYIFDCIYPNRDPTSTLHDAPIPEGTSGILIVMCTSMCSPCTITYDTSPLPEFPYHYIQTQYSGELELTGSSYTLPFNYDLTEIYCDVSGDILFCLPETWTMITCPLVADPVRGAGWYNVKTPRDSFPYEGADIILNSKAKCANVFAKNCNILYEDGCIEYHC